MGDGPKRVEFLKKFAATSTVSVSLAVSGFLLAGCVMPPVGIVYMVNYVDPDGIEESTPPEVDTITESEVAEGDVVEVVVEQR